MFVHRMWYFLVQLLPFELLRLEGFRRFESNLIVNSRQSVYEGLVAKGFMNKSHGSVPKDMMFMTFERCGIVARELELVLAESLGYKAFEFISLKGHYAVKSQCSGLVYDLVSNEGVSLGNVGKLQYADYLRSKVTTTQRKDDFVEEYLTANAPTDGFKKYLGENWK